ncbi:uncharacterized protein BP01DRAFT_117465 [Aspergillus saccharolyticus JOP 1030-1]|uniref:Uncharacterized protein n=1 Tax=Aspergillus saccharolyticus JOP 1030-1 TaxID=1450539 RepID=A0A319ABE5_9EURO|nr:hypothetical protein BP01DRAFT_117465 [Aspergillus saccharolyticus JOP 1030-1]PYH48968.1 hypothetical protein BP01DRAFT_117465 [Aspergillus saccharolyticus JOP 1030-1]
MQRSVLVGRCLGTTNPLRFLLSFYLPQRRKHARSPYQTDKSRERWQENGHIFGCNLPIFQLHFVFRKPPSIYLVLQDLWSQKNSIIFNYLQLLLRRICMNFLFLSMLFLFVFLVPCFSPILFPLPPRSPYPPSP